MRILTPLGLVLVLAVILLPLELRASSILAPRDLGELVNMSDQVVLAKATGRETFSRGWMIVTRTRFEIVQNVKGLSAGRFIYVDSPGGTIGDTGVSVTGSPEFGEGEHYLLMLNAGSGGVWRPVMLSYGLLELDGAADSGVFRPLEQASQLDLVPRKDASPTERIELYDAAALLTHLRQVAVGAAWDASLVVAHDAPLPLDPGASIMEFAPPVGCAFLTDAGAIPIRWNRFDQGLDVTFYIQEGASSIQRTSVMNGLAGWNALGDMSFAGKLVFGDERSLDVDCEVSDGSALNALLTEEAGFLVGDGMVQYGDPCNEIEDLEDCIGVLAIGGTFFYTNQNHSHNGTPWRTSALAFVIVNDGAEACLSSIQYHQMMAHELGHTLGFGHHTSQPALMNAFCCNPMSAIDIQCAVYSYGELPPNAAPEVIAEVEPIELLVPGPSVVLDFVDPPLFADSDGDPLVYQIGLLETGIVFVEFVTATSVRLTGINPGVTTLIVRANDNKGGIADLYVTVRVDAKPNTPPVVVRQPAPVSLLEDQQLAVLFLGEEPVFTDPDGELLALEAVSADEDVVEVAVVEGSVRFTGTGPGTTVVTVTAFDGRDGQAELDIVVSVDGKPVILQNPAPVALTVAAAPVVIDAASPALFADPEEQPLVFSATTNYNLILAVSVSGSLVTFSPIGPGNATVLLSATDVKGSTTSMVVPVNVAARPNNPPIVANPPSVIELRAGAEPYRRDLTAAPALFTDADGDVLNFSANSLAGQIVTARMDGGVLEISPLRPGSASVNVIAVDGFGGLAIAAVPVVVGAPVSLDEEDALPTEYALGAAFPNPFNPTTVLPVELPATTDVRLNVYDLMGRLVSQQTMAGMRAGRHEIGVDLRSRPSGVYFVRVLLGGVWFKQQITLIK